MEACSCAHHWGRQLLELGFAVASAAGAREALCPAQQERRSRRGGDLRRQGVRVSASFPCALSRTRRHDAPSSARAYDRATRGGARRPARPSVGNRGRRRARRWESLCPQAAGLRRRRRRRRDRRCRLLRVALLPLVRQIDALDEAIEAIDKELEASAQDRRDARRLMTSRDRPGHRYGASRHDPDFATFSSGRIAAFLGLTPRSIRPAASRSSGGSPRWATATCQASGRGRLLRARRPQRA